MMERLQTMKLLSLAVSLAVSMSACGSATAPTPLPAPTRPTATLSGLVFGITPTGLKPIDGARVRLEIGSYRQDALTDQNGRYRLTELYEGSSSVTTTRDGYDTDIRKITITGDVVMDIGVELKIAHTLSGVVFEVTPAGQAPIEGVQVYCDSCGEFGHTFAHTDANGFYIFPAVFNGSNPLIVGKDGYRDPPGLPPGPLSQGWRQVTVKGDTRFDIELVRR